MPFESKAQQRFMFARHPKIAKRWAKEYDTDFKKLPERVKKKKRVVKEGYYMRPAFQAIVESVRTYKLFMGAVGNKAPKVAAPILKKNASTVMRSAMKRTV